MVRVVRDYEGSATIIRQMHETKIDCILVSPYVQLWDKMRDAIERAIRKNVNITSYIREPDNDKDSAKLKETISELEKMGVQVFVVKNLHAKIYAFDNTAIVSSMNLYDYSQAHSIELSVLIDDEISLAEIKDFIQEHIVPKAKPFGSKPVETKSKKTGFCIHCGKTIEYPEWGNPICSDCFKKEKSEKTLSRDIDTAPAPKQSVGSKAQNFISKVTNMVAESLQRFGGNKGYCIRCKAEIDNDPAYPLCGECYKKWKVFKNPEYTEKYCLACGRPSKTSFSKPYCYDCYKNG